MPGMTYRGITKGYVTVLRGTKRPPWAPVKRNILTIPGRAGGLLQTTDTDVRQEDVPIRITARDYADLQKVKEDLADWLITDEPQELVFDDEPGRTYYAVVDGSLDIEEMVDRGKGVITFLCPDPYKYGAGQTVALTTDRTTVTNPGTAETYPVIEATFANRTTYFAVSDGVRTVLLGKPADVTVVPVLGSERVLWDEMTSTAAWAASASVDGGGAIAGNFTSDGFSFGAADYGAGAGWHGPALQRALPAPLQDFRIGTIMEFDASDKNQVGQLVLYLRDQNGVIFGKIGVMDSADGQELSRGLARFGGVDNTGYSAYYGIGYEWGWWNNFYGELSIARRGQEWTFYMSHLDRATNRRTGKDRIIAWTDTSNDYGGHQLAAVEIYAAAYGNLPPVAVARIHDIKVSNEHVVTPEQVPYIVEPGDKITVDCSKAAVFKNGTPFFQFLDPISDFPRLNPGDTILAYDTGDLSATVTATFRGRWL